MSIFLDACWRKPTPRTPVWFMRQAGRYQPSYRAIRQKVAFLELCKNPELACEVTVNAVNELGVDAAIIFADILLILDPLGVPFSFDANNGPRIATPLRTPAQVDELKTEIAARESLGYVMNAIRLARAELKVPLIGFAGAPFTLAAYAIEGGGSRSFHETRRFMLEDEMRWSVLMDKLVAATSEYLNAQVEAGAQALQLFDSWAGCLSGDQYQQYVAPAMQKLFSTLPKDVPVISFATGNPALYPNMTKAGGQVIGVDWRQTLDDAWAVIGHNHAVMGNLDPAALLASRARVLAESEKILRYAAGRPGHIFNVGHGILPETSVDQVRAVVDYVHETSSRTLTL